MQRINESHYSNYRTIDENINNNYSNYRTIERVPQGKEILRKEQAEKLIDEVVDLIDDPSYRPFFFKRLYKTHIIL